MSSVFLTMKKLFSFLRSWQGNLFSLQRRNANKYIGTYYYIPHVPTIKNIPVVAERIIRQWQC